MFVLFDTLIVKNKKMQTNYLKEYAIDNNKLLLT